MKYTRYVKEDSTKSEAALHLMTTLPQEANNIVHISMIRGLQVCVCLGGWVGGCEWLGGCGWVGVSG